MTEEFPDGQPDYAEYLANRLEAYRGNFESSGNGCWAWMAINLCLGGETPWNSTPPPPFPKWTLAYLKEAAEFVYSVGMPPGPLLRGKSIENTSAPDIMLRMLGLLGVKQGENRFKDFANDMQAYQYAVFANYAGDEHVIKSKQDAVDQRTDPDAVRRQVRRAIRRGRKRFPYLGISFPEGSKVTDDTAK